MKRVAVVVRDKGQQYEALRPSLGALLESHAISYFVLGEEIDMTEEFRDNLDIFGEMDGLCYSNNQANIDKHGFQPLAEGDLALKLRDVDIVIPFH